MLPRAAVTAVLVLLVAASAGAAATVWPHRTLQCPTWRRRSIASCGGRRPYHPEYW